VNEKNKIPTNVIYVHRTQGIGVERVHIKGIVNAFEKKNINVSIVANLPDMSNSNHNISLSIRLISLVSSKLPEVVFEIGEIFYNILLYLKIRKIVKIQEVDFIYERYAFFNFSTMLISKMYKIPYFVEVNYLSDTLLVRKRTKLLQWLQRIVERRVLNNAAGLFVITKYVRDGCLKMKIDPKKVIITPNAIDQSSIKIAKEKVSLKKQLNIEKELIIGFVGGFYEWHGLDFLVEVGEKLLHKNQNLRFLLVGDGPLKEKIQLMVDELGITDKFIFPGKINHENLWSYLNLFDIAVIPKTNEYGSPVKLFEYMAIGSAVIAPSVGPVKEIITDNENGVLFQSEDKDDFIEKMLYMINDTKKRQIIGAKAKEYVYKNHTWKNNSDKILNQYNQINSVS
jgi:glycosyltransferase involved in cell wall biosynthesis